MEPWGGKSTAAFREAFMETFHKPEGLERETHCLPVLKRKSYYNSSSAPSNEVCIREGQKEDICLLKINDSDANF